MLWWTPNKKQTGVKVVNEAYSYFVEVDNKASVLWQPVVQDVFHKNMLFDQICMQCSSIYESNISLES